MRARRLHLARPLRKQRGRAEKGAPGLWAVLTGAQPLPWEAAVSESCPGPVPPGEDCSRALGLRVSDGHPLGHSHGERARGPQPGRERAERHELSLFLPYVVALLK